MEFGPYRIESELGRGGMGTVYRAWDTRRGRIVALKVLADHLVTDDTFRERFRREAHAAAGLGDPHVVPIHDYGEIDGRLFLDMRLVEGTDLATLLTHGPLPPPRAVALLGQLAEALDAAHATGLVHRDVKPANVLITASDFVYLVDFGLARSVDDQGTSLTSTGTTIGSVDYMAPERFDGAAPQASADVYSVTCVLHEMLTGYRPFPAGTATAVMRGHVLSPPPRPSARVPLSPAFDDVVARGMAKDPAARPPTVGALAAAAREALADRTPRPGSGPTGLMPTGPAPGPHGAPGPSAPPLRRRATRRLEVLVAVLAVVAVLGVVLLLVRGGGGGATPTPAPAAAPSPTVDASATPTDAAEAGALPAGITGSWLGSGDGTDVAVSVYDGAVGERVTDVSFPTLGCQYGGVRTGGSGSSVEVTLTSEVEGPSCVDGGPASLTLSADAATLTYRFPFPCPGPNCGSPDALAPMSRATG